MLVLLAVKSSQAPRPASAFFGNILRVLNAKVPGALDPELELLVVPDDVEEALAQDAEELTDVSIGELGVLEEGVDALL